MGQQDAEQPQGPTGRWEILLDEPFNGPELDTRIWHRRFPWHPRVINDELQYYDPSPDANVSIRDGVLRLKAEDRPQGGLSHTSGLISSHDRFFFKYGVAEARIRVPRGRGLWSAFWMMPQDRVWPPEIDIVEHVGHEPGSISSNVHWGTPEARQSSVSFLQGPDFTDDFHVYTVEWSADAVAWYVDGVRYAEFDDTAFIPHKDMYLLVSLAVGGTFPGPPDSTTVFPAFLEVDYIRAWRPS